MARFQTSGRLSAVHVSQARLAADVAELVTAAALSLSTSQTSQLELTFSDPQLALVAGGFLPKRTPVSYAGLHLEVAVRETVQVGGGLPGLKVTARSQGIQRLKRRVGAHAWSGLSYTQWLGAEARAVGAGFIGQPSGRRRQVLRLAEKGQPRESSWDVAQRAAGELGFIAFEAAGVIYFGRPSWIVKTQPRHTLRWSAGGGGSTDPRLLSVPAIRDSDDDLAHGFTGTLSCGIDLAETLMPGHGLTLAGLGPFSAAPFLIAACSLNLLDPAGGQNVEVQTPVDPPPQLGSGYTGADFRVPVGKFAGVPLDAGQVEVAEVAYVTAKTLGATDRDIEVVLMAGMVESRLRNLQGPPTDHDSLGFLQQRANWGSVAERTNVAAATTLFLASTRPRGLFAIANRSRIPRGELAQKVQVSAYPDRYAGYQKFAIALLDAIHRAGG